MIQESNSTQPDYKANPTAIHKKQEIISGGTNYFNLRWNWIFTCIGIVVLLLVINYIVLYVAYSKSGSVSVFIPPLVILFSQVFIFFLGSFITAILSPGKSITEAAIACAVVTVLFSFLAGNPDVIFFGWLSPFFIGLAGARLGEFISDKMNKKEKYQQTRVSVQI